MLTLRIAAGLALAAFAGSQGYAADLGPPVVYEADEAREPAPYYVVDHGPGFTGPGITVEKPGLESSDVRLHYPFIGLARPVVERPSWDDGYPPAYRRGPVLRRLGAAAPATRLAGVDRTTTATIAGEVETTGTTPRRRPPPTGVFRARAEVHMKGLTRIDIKLFRDDVPKASRPPPSQAERDRLLRRALQQQKARRAPRAHRERAYRAYPYDSGWSGRPTGPYRDMQR